MRIVDDDPRRAIADGDFYSLHRDELGEVGARALVAWPVQPKEVKDNPKAQASLDVEYDALCDDLKAWDMVGVREWFDAQAQAERNGKMFHVGMIFGICVEKNADLPARTESTKGVSCSRETTSGTKET